MACIQGSEEGSEEEYSSYGLRSSHAHAKAHATMRRWAVEEPFYQLHKVMTLVSMGKHRVHVIVMADNKTPADAVAIYDFTFLMVAFNGTTLAVNYPVDVISKRGTFN